MFRLAEVVATLGEETKLDGQGDQNLISDEDTSNLVLSPWPEARNNGDD